MAVGIQFRLVAPKPAHVLPPAPRSGMHYTDLRIRISPLRLGRPARQTHDYQRNGLTSLYAAREVASGNVVGECSDGHTRADFLRFLKVLARCYPARELHAILDNFATHKTPDVPARLAAHPRVHSHFTPTGASWLNMVEAWFSILTRKSVRRARSHDCQDGPLADNGQ